MDCSACNHHKRRESSPSLTESTGIWEVGLLRKRAWSEETSILAFCKVGGGDRVGGGKRRYLLRILTRQMVVVMFPRKTNIPTSCFGIFS